MLYLVVLCCDSCSSVQNALNASSVYLNQNIATLQKMEARMDCDLPLNYVNHAKTIENRTKCRCDPLMLYGPT